MESERKPRFSAGLRPQARRQIPDVFTHERFLHDTSRAISISLQNLMWLGDPAHGALRAWTGAKAQFWLLLIDARLRGVRPRLKSRASTQTYGRFTSPFLIAYTTSSAVLCSPSAFMMLARCTATVFTLTS